MICACRCLAVFGAAYLTGPCEKKNILLWMNESCVKAFHRENYKIIAYLNFQFSFP